MATEEVKVEEVHDSSSEEEIKTTAGADGAAAGEEAAAGRGKHSRSEKKARKAVERLGLKKVPGVMRVRVKKGKSVLFVINGPEVFKSPSNDTTYVIFGEAKMDQDLAGQALSEQANIFKNPTPVEGDDDIPELVPTTAETGASATEEKVSDDIESKIPLVQEQTSCSRAAAIRALKETDGDVVTAILKASSY